MHRAALLTVLTCLAGGALAETGPTTIPLPKGKNLTLLPPKNMTALALGLKAVLEEALEQNLDVLATFKNRTAVELAENVEEWRTEHEGGPPGKVLWKLLPKGGR